MGKWLYSAFPNSLRFLGQSVCISALGVIIYLEMVFGCCVLCCNFLCCVILQALPYIRCIGESWPMTKERAYFEAVALREQARLSPEHVPEVYHFDRTMSLIGMRYLEPPHIILRKGLIAGIEYPLLAEHISEFMARTLYFTSLLHRSTTEHKRAGVWYFLLKCEPFML